MADRRPLALAVYALLAANLLTLWLARGEYVNGWDLFGATFGVLKLHEGSLADGVRAIWHSVLNQRARPVFTGGESMIYGLIPGLLNLAHPWLLWTHLVNLVLLVLVSTWLVRVLGCRAWIYWACILASPALTAQAIVGLPDQISNLLTYGPAIAWVLVERRRRRSVIVGIPLDLVVFAAITAVAFNGYESGKSFFVVPAVAAFTLRGVPIVRRACWLACAVAVAWFVRSLAPGTMNAALVAVPHEPLAFAAGIGRLLHAYFVDWYIDFPALLVAALVGLLALDRDRAFFAALFLAVGGLVSLNAFQLNGSFLVPHRFLLVGLVSALIVTRALSGTPPRVAAVAMGGLLALGAAYTTFSTVRFATAGPYDLSVRPAQRIYALPYNWAQADANIWPGRIHDAGTLARVVRDTTEPHVVFYGFSLLGEDTVNPQLIPARLILQLGWDTFARRVHLFDHERFMFFEFPIRPLRDVPATLASLPTPFYVHVEQPEYSIPSLLDRYLNAATVTPVELGLTNFRSFRVDRYAPPGPMSLAPGAVRQQPEAPVADGLCLEFLLDVPPIPLLHRGPLPQAVPDLVADVTAPDGPSTRRGVTRRRVPAVNERVQGPMAVHATGFVDNDTETPRLVRFTVTAEHEVVVLANGKVVIESLSRNEPTTYTQEALLPPGRTAVTFFARRFWDQGPVRFEAAYADGTPVAWKTRESCR